MVGHHLSREDRKHAFIPGERSAHPACPRLLLGPLHERLSSVLQRPQPPGGGAFLWTWEGTLGHRLQEASAVLVTTCRSASSFWLYLVQNCFTYGLAAKSCLTLATTWTVAPRLLCPWDFPGKSPGVDSHLLLQGDLPDPGIEPACPTLAGGFFTAEPPGAPAVCVWLTFR